MFQKLFVGCVAAGAALWMGGCGHSLESEPNDFASLDSALTNNGTAVASQCVEGEATVDLEGTLTSQAASPATLTVSIGGGPPQTLGTVSTWSGGATKTANYAFQIVLGSGTYALEVCASQPGQTASCIQHNLVIACSQPNEGDDENSCEGISFFGAVTSSKGAGPVLPIQVRGTLGAYASLYVEGPDGLHYSGQMWRAGRSCIYHAKVPRPAGGLFTFTVVDETDSFSEQIEVEFY